MMIVNRKKNGESESICYRRICKSTCYNEYKLSVEYYDKYNQYLRLADPYGDKWSWSFEAFIVNRCDEICQRKHDIEDGLESKILIDNEVVEMIEREFNWFINKEPKIFKIEELKKAIGEKDFVTDLSRFILRLYSYHLLNNCIVNMKYFIFENKIKNRNWDEFYLSIDSLYAAKLIEFDNDFKSADEEFKKFLKSRMINSYKVQRMNGQGTYVINKLFKSYH